MFVLAIFKLRSHFIYIKASSLDTALFTHQLFMEEK